MQSPARTQRVRKLKAFVSYSSDTVAFAKALVALGKEISTEAGRTEDWVVDVLIHEVNVNPDIGDNPQDVIDKQLSGDFDLFVMLVWARIGSKLKSGLTGLEHEFAGAKAKREAHGQKPVIAVFFCDGAIAPSKIDPDQLAGVHKFKSEVQSALYYKTFTTKKELCDRVRASLKQTAAIKPVKPSKAASPSSNFDDLNKPLPGLAKKVRASYPDDDKD